MLSYVNCESIKFLLFWISFAVGFDDIGNDFFDENFFLRSSIGGASILSFPFNNINVIVDKGLPLLSVI